MGQSRVGQSSGAGAKRLGCAVDRAQPEPIIHAHVAEKIGVEAQLDSGASKETITEHAFFAVYTAMQRLKEWPNG